MDTNIQHIKPSGYLPTEPVKGSIFRSLSLSKGNFQLSTFNFLFFFFLSTFTFHLPTYSQTSQPFPTDHLQLWLRADSVELTDGKVSRWYDLSPNNYVIQQTDQNARPTIMDSAINGWPALKFNGTSAFLNGGNILNIGTKGWTYIVVAKLYNTNTQNWFFSKGDRWNGWLTTGHNWWIGNFSSFMIGSNYTQNIAYNHGIANTYAIFGYELYNRSSLTNKGFLNNNNTYTGNITDTNVSNTIRFVIGGGHHITQNGYQYYSGEIAEIIALDTTNDDYRQQISNYLLEKYSRYVSLGQDIHTYSFCDTAITTAYNPDFSSYLWSTGETDSIIKVNHTGRYTVTVTNSFGVTSTDDINVYFPEVLQMIDTTICAGDTTYWTTGLSSEDYTFQWFMDSTPLPLQSKSPLNVNPYQSSLQALQPLKDNQYHSPLRALQPLKARPSSSSLPIHSSGSYYCIITDSLGCSFHTDTINISVDYYPISASFSRGAIPCASSDTSLCVGNTLGLATNIEETSSYIWSTDSESPRITITDSGEYTLTSTNTRGCVAVNSINITILGEAPEISYAVDNTCFKDSTSFVGNAYSEQGIESYLWIIDNTDTITAQSFNYSFASTGNHNIRTIVTSNNTCLSDSSFTINIKEIPEPNFTYTPVCTGIPMTFIDNSTIPDGTYVESYTWLINDSIIGTNENLTFSTDDASIVPLTYILSLSNGCSSDTTIEVSANSEYSEPRFVSPAYPSDGMIVTSDSITFLWNYDYDILYYDLITSPSADFTNADTIACSTNGITMPSETFADTTYWKVTAYNHCLVSFESEPYFFRKTTDGSLSVSSCPNLQLWLRADSVELTDGKVSRWYDLSPNNYVIQQTDQNARPTIMDSAINGWPALKFNGTSAFLNGGNILNIGTKGWTYIVVAKLYNTNTQNWFFSKGDRWNGWLTTGHNWWIGNFSSFMIGSNYTQNIAYNHGIANTYAIFGYELYNRSSLTNKGFLNNNNTYTGNITDTNVSNTIRFVIGGGHHITQTGYQYYCGEIAEIIALDTTNDDFRQQISNYLLEKYSRSVSLGLDIHAYGFGDTTITTAYNPDFTSYLWSTGETDSVIHISQPGRYTVTVTNSFGVTSTDDIKVYFPEVYQLQDTTICAGDTIRWDLKLPQNDYSYQWFKDGEEYNDEYHYLPIFEEGAYNCLITDSLGCTFITDTMHLAIDNYEHTASFGNADTTLCYGNRLRLLSNYEETASAIWQDGNTNLEYYLSQPGTYTVTTTNARGCQAVNTINVNLQGQVPVANFSIEGHCQNAEVFATNLSTSEMGEISLYRWYANDSLIGTDANASHIFTEYGQQNIKLYLETTDNCINDTTISVYIDPQPQPDFTPKFFCQNAQTEIHTQSSIAEGNVTAHSWIINSEPQTGDNITAMFCNNGINALTLSAESEQGCIGTKDIEVNVLQAEMPTTEISGICLGHETTFINKTPFNNINPQTAWEWNFGDDTETSPNKNTTHTYDTTGTYNVSLTVSFANHCSTTTDTTITIHELPEATITANDGCVGSETTLDAEIISVDNITAYKWQIDSIFESSEQHPTFVADTTGTFAVTLDIKTEYACSSQTTDSITIYENPSIMFTQSRDWGGNPLYVEFENMSNGATSYHWDFGGMGESTQPNPYFIFTAPGTYNVTLAGTSSDGCTSRYTSAAITVVEPIVDIMLMDLKTTIENSFAKVSFVIVNLGTLPVEDLVLELRFNDRTLRESIDYIAQGEVRPYTFGTQMPVPQSNDIKSTICVEAIVPDTEGHSDTNLTNNILCITDAENLSVGIPYPIPAREQITCDIYTKIPTDLDISIFNIFGKLVKHEQISQHKGYMKYVVNVTDLASGMYFIRVNSKDESITHKFEIR